MIQRKQTIYLALALGCQLIMLFVSIFTVSSTDMGKSVTGSFGAHGVQGEEYSQEMPIYLIFASLALLSALGIFLYKKRGRQLMICRINLILNILVVFALSLFFYVGKGIVLDQLKEEGFEQVEFKLATGFFVAVAAIPFLIMAIRGIKSDEKLLKSIDRIR